MGNLFEAMLNLFAGLVEACSWLWIYLDVPIFDLVEGVVEVIPGFGGLYDVIRSFITDIFGTPTFLNDITIFSLITTLLPAIFIYMVLKNFVFK